VITRRFVLVAVVLAGVLSLAAHAACDTALLVIDVQELFLTFGEWPTSSGEGIVAAVARVLSLARSAGVPVIYIQDFSIPQADTLYEGQLGFPAAISPQRGEPVFAKFFGDAFTTAEFAEYMQEQGIERVFFCGIASGGCVQATLFSAITKGYDTAVVADAHSNGSGDAGASLIGFSHQSSEKLNRYWKGLGISVAAMDDIDWDSLGCNAEAD